jgi:aerobic C4-dicarboxylate transport protein
MRAISTLSAMQIVPIEGIALVLGVDRFMSEARSITNLIGNAAAALVVARSEGAFDDRQRTRAIDEVREERRAAAA